MSPLAVLFIAFVAAGSALRLWLTGRQQAAVRTHRDAVPEPFRDTITLEDHQRAAQYTLAQLRLARVDIVVDAAVVLALTVGGGIASIDALWTRAGLGAVWHGTAVVLTVLATVSVIELPLSAWRTFGVEARFGFNRMTPALFAADAVRGLLLSLVLGAPLLIAVLWLMQQLGPDWWLAAWLVWAVFTLVVTWAWPAFIAPLFNRFEPLADAALRQRIEALLERTGFRSRGVFVMDGSRRSTHGNAYFTGVGRNKRIVFFDTLVARLDAAEIEAVLAHELGHYRLHHVRQRLVLSLAATLVALYVIGQLAAWPPFFTALGVATPSNHAALLLFLLAMPVFTVFLSPVAAAWSRRHEFAADEFAGREVAPLALVSALVKLYRDNATTLTPDPLYAAFHYSHPPALARIARLQSQAGAAG